MRIRLDEKILPVIPTASMADIAFLLIIFFMLTTSFSPVRKSVVLPESEVRTEVQQDAAIVALDVDGSMAFSDGVSPQVDVLSLEQLESLIRATLLLDPEREFVLRAARDARYELIDSVLDRLRASGARNIGLLTEQRRAGGG